MRYFALLIVPLLAGCSTNGVPQALPKKPIPITPELLEFAEKHNQFAFELYDRVKGKEGNLVVSPYSVWTAMAMVYAGAATQTAEEIRGTLHLPNDHALAMNLSRDLRQSISYSKEGEPPFVETNHMWPADNFASYASYREVITETFQGGVTHLPYFMDATGSRRKINNHVAKATRQRIPELFTADNIGPHTQLALTNAIVFDSLWATPFEKHNTKLMPFRVSHDRTLMVPTMTAISYPVNYTKAGGFEAIELPLRQPDFSFVVILPELGQSLESLEAGAFNKNPTGKLLQELHPTSANLRMPTFSFDWSKYLEAVLQTMGIRLAFSDHADFSRLTGGQIAISTVVHKAAIVVDEKGAQAAAATGVLFGETISDELTLSVDRPFLIVLFHRPTQTILFLGRVSDPSANVSN